MIKLLDNFWKHVTGEAQAIDRSMKYQRIVRLLKEFDSEYELMFKEPGPVYDSAGNLKLEEGLDVRELLPHIIRMVNETARRQRES